jgi:hypothetical protein
VGDIIVAAAASSSLTGATIFKGYVGEKVLTALLLISTVTAIVKPLLKLNKKIASAAKLQRDYLCLYQKLNRLRRDIRKRLVNRIQGVRLLRNGLRHSALMVSSYEAVAPRSG